MSSDFDIKVRDLESATAGLVCVKPEDELTLARTRMLLKDYSQLGVQSNTKSLEGYVSWESIGRSNTSSGAIVRDAMSREPRVVESDRDLLPLVSEIASGGYAFVRHQGFMTGIITAEDLTIFFRRHAEPFLLVGSIERSLRTLLRGHLSREELVVSKDPADRNRTVEAVEDLSLGELLRLFESEDTWARVNMQLHRREFVKALHEVREVRNDLMHFRPDPPAAEQCNMLQRVASILRSEVDAPERDDGIPAS